MQQPKLGRIPGLLGCYGMSLTSLPVKLSIVGSECGLYSALMTSHSSFNFDILHAAYGSGSKISSFCVRDLVVYLTGETQTRKDSADRQSERFA